MPQTAPASAACCVQLAKVHPGYGKPPFAAQMTAEELREFQKQLAYDTYQATKSYAGQPGQW